MSVFVVFPSGRTTSVYHTDKACPTFKPNTYVRETSKEQAIDAYDAELCGRCADETVYIKRHHVETYHVGSDCQYLARVDKPREVEKETATGFFDAEPCESCGRQSNDHSHFMALKEAAKE